MNKPIQLPYPIDALEPYYDRQTLKLHYDVLYKGYVENLNKTEEKLEKSRQILNFENIKCLEKELSFQGSGVILHELFFKNLTPPIPTSPSLELLEQIQKDFTNFETFKQQFNNAATTVEASGWCLLVYTKQLSKLHILQCEKHQNLTLWGCIPLLVIDMWEHSYYLQYKTSRKEYINAIWNIVNWNVVNNRYKKIQK